MISKKFLSVILILAFFSPVVVAQAPATRSKEDKKQAEEESLEQKAYGLLNEVVKEGQMLKLPENRVKILATAAALILKRDPKLARSLVAQVATDINELFHSPDDSDQGYSPKRSIAFQLRQEVMQILAGKDAKLAREFMAATRPSNNSVGGLRNEDYLATPEVEATLELDLAAQIAATDPKQALQIAEASLSKGLSDGLHQVLARLQVKDRESADKLFDAILKKLQSEEVADNNVSLVFAVTMLRFMTRAEENQDHSIRDGSTPKKPLLAADEKSLKLLAGIIAEAALSKNLDVKSEEVRGEEFERMMALQPVMNEIEKYAPERAPALRKKMNELTAPMEPGAKFYMEFQSSMESDDPDLMLKLIEKAPEQMRESMQMEAAVKLIRMGEYDRARELMNSSGGDPTYRKNIFKMIDASLVERAAVEGQIDLARQKLSELDSNEERAQILIKLANGAAGKRDKKIALQLLHEAGSLLNAQAENYIHLGTRIQLALAYVQLEPGRSFEIAELAIDQLNTLVTAAEALNGFQPLEYFRNGEMQPNGPTIIISLIDQTISTLSALAKVDFVRARAGADKFQRPETRARALLSLAKAILSEQSQPSSSTSNAVQFYTPRRY